LNFLSLILKKNPERYCKMADNKDDRLIARWKTIYSPFDSS